MTSPSNVTSAAGAAISLLGGAPLPRGMGPPQPRLLPARQPFLLPLISRPRRTARTFISQ
ncbi:unnamed protein product, partial [Nesidiocoris tenuis]